MTCVCATYSLIVLSLAYFVTCVLQSYFAIRSRHQSTSRDERDGEGDCWTSCLWPLSHSVYVLIGRIPPEQNAAFHPDINLLNLQHETPYVNNSMDPSFKQEQFDYNGVYPEYGFNLPFANPTFYSFDHGHPQGLQGLADINNQFGYQEQASAPPPGLQPYQESHSQFMGFQPFTSGDGVMSTNVDPQNLQSNAPRGIGALGLGFDPGFPLLASPPGVGDGVRPFASGLFPGPDVVKGMSQAPQPQVATGQRSNGYKGSGTGAGAGAGGGGMQAMYHGS